MCDKVGQGERVSKLARNSVTYFMDGPLFVRNSRTKNNSFFQGENYANL